MQLTPESPSVAQVLKRETDIFHQQVEAVLLPYLTSIRSEQEYISILKMFYGFFHPMEKMIQMFITTSVLHDILSRRTSLLILDDLQALESSTTNIPQSHDLPIIKNEAAAFGVMYVLEGSTLGGKMIAKMLSKNPLFPVPQEALNFFNGYKEKTGSMWTTFLTELNKQVDIKTVIASANDTFLQLKTWMQHSFVNG